MKPAAFEYTAPRTVDEVLALLAQHGSEAKVIAGGQSLVPMLNFRLARPAHVIDLNHVNELAGLQVTAGKLNIGALARTAHLERSVLVGKGWPMLRTAAALVGHPAIRNRGTVGGSAAHADPAAELPVALLALLALDAHFYLRSMSGERTLAAVDFFQDFYTTALEPEELLVRIQVPEQPHSIGTAFLEHARTHGDFALAGVAASIVLRPDGACASAAIALLGGGATPLRSREAEAYLVGTIIDDATAREAGVLASRSCDPTEPADYRRALIAELTRRSVQAAAARATQ